jgi:hypothetical protein
MEADQTLQMAARRLFSKTERGGLPTELLEPRAQDRPAT